MPREAISNRRGNTALCRLIGSRVPHSLTPATWSILVVVEESAAVPETEILRVLAPGGVARVKEGDGWRTVKKARPDTIDEWTHFLHDAGNNAVARDSEVGPPRCLQWVAPPLWLRSHETPSGFQSLVSSAGRVFYFLDEGIVGITDQRLPERWALLCRDAFNGKLIWRRPLAAWGWPEWATEKFAGVDWTEIRGGRTVVPVETQRRLVADGDRIYATLGFQSPLVILDAATGQQIAAVPETGAVKEILASEGTVIVTSRPDRPDTARRRGKAATSSALLSAVDGQTGKLLWREGNAADPGFVRGGRRRPCRVSGRYGTGLSGSGYGFACLAQGGLACEGPQFDRV